MVKSLVAFLTTPFLIKFLPLIIGPFFDAEVKLEFDDEVNLHNEYDYIIVGSSPAGCVLANRLSENHKHSVLLLEEGSKFHEFAKIPGLDFLFSQTIYSKTYKSKAQEKSCFSVTNRECPITIGKGLGGSSNLDENIYLRGDFREYDSWTKLGLRNWRYEYNLPYFMQIERLLENFKGQKVEYGRKGSISLRQNSFTTDLTESVLKGLKEIGIKYGDVHSGDSVISTPLLMQSNNGTRISAFNAFVEPILDRSNLKVATFSKINRINFIGPRAESVSFEHKKEQMKIYARKEIIIALDAINTPKLLMLSGIGSKSLLKKHSIPVISDLESVGKNLVSPICSLSINYAINSNDNSKEKFSEKNYRLYMDKGIGRYASTGHDLIGLFPSQVIGYNESGHWPDLQLSIFTGGVVDNEGVWNRKRYSIDAKTWKEYFEPYIKKKSATFMVCLARPLSRGVVQIVSSDPNHDPLLNPMYNDHPSDLQALAKGMMIALKIGNTRALDHLNIQLYEKKIPACSEFKIYSAPYLACSGQALVTSSLHLAGTARMGHPEDPNAVCNQQLIVKGTKNLRIIDSSVLPTRPSLSVAPELMIGLRAAQFILQSKHDQLSTFNMNMNLLPHPRPVG